MKPLTLIFNSFFFFKRSLCLIFIFPILWTVKGQFGPEQLISGGNLIDPESIHVADLNGDTLPDVLVTSLDDHKVGWYANLGEGKFGSLQIIDEDLKWR